MSAAIPVDVPGRTVSFRPSMSSHILKGEVVKVWYNIGEDPRYPKGSKGHKNGIRKLYKKMSVILPDGRILNMSAEQDDIKAIEMVAENLNDHEL